MTAASTTTLAVLGSPIEHSKSPALHLAAYRALGLDWQYGQVEMTGDRLAEFIRTRDASWRGLSLTMPLKQDVLPLLDSIDARARLTGAANTLVFDDGIKRGFNTDIAGITGPFRAAGVTHLDRVLILGGGATAASALVAVSELGATTVTIAVRTPAKAAPLVELGTACGVTVHVVPLGEVPTVPADAVISTLPNGALYALEFPQDLRADAVLFDVAYDPWPTALASAWSDAAGRVIPGIEMLIGQALIQVRVFVTGDPDTVLPDEDAVHQAMREAVGVGPAPLWED
ncbi:shikimate dehydrogenase [Diaminobutyricimonas sp. TR449]|uniref:shikimate dehydrogenase n=1 Tax=Diaminobutyricimonas sp. TR449 TaxID=2708076 RepID=UPI00141FAAAF|nr:shikimate dehydrogenase [Diaminobutyricimonas sp. TR449]